MAQKLIMFTWPNVKFCCNNSGLWVMKWMDIKYFVLHHSDTSEFSAFELSINEVDNQNTILSEHINLNRFMRV